MTEPTQIALAFLEFELDPREGTLKRAGQLVEVQPKVFEALVFFAKRPERLVTKQELMQALWPDTVVEEASLTQVVFKLRRALGEPESPRVLHTVVKRGFRFGTPVQVMTLVPTPPTPPPRSPILDNAESFPPGATSAPAPTPTPPTAPPRSPILDNAESLAPGATSTSAPTPTPPPTPPTPAPRSPILDNAAPSAAESSTPAPASTSAPRPTRTPSTRWLVLAAVIALVLLAFIFWPASPISPLRGDPQTRLTTRLTRLPERDQEPSLAPDQTWFAFASTRGTGRYSIWVQRLDSGDPVQITRPLRGEDTTPHIFPDGRAVAFTRCETTNPHAPGCAVWSAAPLGGDERLLVADCNLGDLHPKRATVLCMRGTSDGAVDFIEAPLDQSRPPSSLHSWRGPLESLRVASTGALAFLSGGEPWLLQPGSTTPKRLFSDPSNVHTLAFSGTGEHLLIDLSRNGRRTLWAAPLESLPANREALLPLTLGNGVDLYPDLSEDGSRLLFTHETSESHLIAVDSRGRTPRRLDTRTSFFTLSLGGVGHLLAVADADSPTGDDVAILDLDELTSTGTVKARGLGLGSAPTLSPDETHVALVDRQALVLVSLADGQRMTLVSAGVREASPAFSPDGASLAFAGVDPPGLSLVSRVTPATPATPTLQAQAASPESRRVRQVAAGHFTSPAFSPDGRFLVASGAPLGETRSGLYAVDLLAPTSPPRLLSEHRSYEAAPLFLGSSDIVWVLVDERTTPRLIPIAIHPDSPPLPDPILLEVPEDPANWGVFRIAAHPVQGFVYLLKKVHADIMMVRANN